MAITCSDGAAHAGEDQRQRARELDLAHDLPAGHAHAAGGVARLGVDALHAGVGVGQDRRDRQQDQHDQHRDAGRAARRACAGCRAPSGSGGSSGESQTMSRTTSPRAGTARIPFARPAITNTPRPVCPTSSPIGRAMISATTTATHGVDDVLAQMRTSRPSGPRPVRRVVEPDADPVEAGQRVVGQDRRAHRRRRPLPRA